MKAKTKKQYKESWKRHVMELNSVGMDLMDISSWIIGCTTEIFPDFDQLKKFLRIHYQQT